MQKTFHLILWIPHWIPSTNNLQKPCIIPVIRCWKLLSLSLRAAPISSQQPKQVVLASIATPIILEKPSCGISYAQKYTRLSRPIDGMRERLDGSIGVEIESEGRLPSRLFSYHQILPCNITTSRATHIHPHLQRVICAAHCDILRIWSVAFGKCHLFAPAGQKVSQHSKWYSLSRMRMQLTKP